MFELNLPQMDWLTVTSFHPHYHAECEDWHRAIGGAEHETKRMQYLGTLRHDRYGTSFVGIGTQKQQDHMLCQVSGSLSESLFARSRARLALNHAKVRRLDLQVTVDYPRSTWSQFDLLGALKDARPNNVVWYRESKSGPQNSMMATVYYGSPSSDRMVRIYEKRGLAEDVYLRFEVEYKDKRAESAANELIGGASTRAILWSEVLRLPDVYSLRRIFGEVLEGESVRIITIREPGQTAEWLTTSVAPALDRWLNEHETHTASMALLFHRIVAPHLP